MTKLNVVDLCLLPECLGSPVSVVSWFPRGTQEEEAMREQRIKDIRYLIDKCEQIIREEAKAHE